MYVLRIEVFVNHAAQLGEGPLWDPRSNRLYWVDTYGKALHSVDSNGGDMRTWSMPEPIGACALREKGGAIVALRSGFFELDFDSGEVKLLCETHPGELRPRFNDGKTDRQGRFIAGTMDFEEEAPVASLFRLDPDLSVKKIDDQIICSNGPCFSPDGRTMYFADSFKKTIFAYEYDIETGNVKSRRVFACFNDFQGYPDGMTVDSEGGVWVVEVYAGRLLRYDSLGGLDRVVGLPVFSSTSIMFGGPNLDIAYITSMARPFGDRYPMEKEAGMVFAIYGLGVKGLPETPFAG
ncbi:MAG: L-arabinonolactonase [Granulosicoccus sp.]